MKKIILIFALFMGISVVSFAQQAPAARQAPSRTNARVVFTVENFTALEQYDVMKNIIQAVDGVIFVNHQIGAKQVVAAYNSTLTSAESLKQLLVDKGWKASVTMTSEKRVPVSKE